MMTWQDAIAILAAGEDHPKRDDAIERIADELPHSHTADRAEWVASQTWSGTETRTQTVDAWEEHEKMYVGRR